MTFWLIGFCYQSFTESQTDQKKVKIYDCFVKNIKEIKNVKSRKKILQDITSPNELSLLRAMKQLSCDVKLDRRTVTKKPTQETKSSAEYKDRRQAIRTFLERPEHSITLPGKKDTITIKKVKHQKIQLTEFLDVLHQKFNRENPERTVSKSFFSSVVEWKEVDRYTVKLSLSSPDADMPFKLTQPQAKIIKKNSMDKWGAGTGPYLLDDFQALALLFVVLDIGQLALLAAVVDLVALAVEVQLPELRAVVALGENGQPGILRVL